MALAPVGGSASGSVSAPETRCTVDDPRLASLRISGVFATNDTAEFARAVAALHGLRVEQAGGAMHIVR